MLNKLQGSTAGACPPTCCLAARLWIYWINQIHLSPNNDTGLPLNVPPL